MERRRWEERAWWRCSALALLALQACTGDITELVVVVDPDIRVPDEIDRVLVVADATAIGGQLHEREAALAGVDPLELPLTLSLVHTGGPLGPLTIDATGADRVDRARCEHGATCDVECNGVRDCRLECGSGAACLLRCTGAESRSFAMCEGGAMSCPGGIEVCNRGCP